MRLQTTNANLKFHAIKVNGHDYPVDRALTVEVPDNRPADIEKLRKLGWSEPTPETLERGMRAKPPPPGRPSLQSAREFVAKMVKDGGLEARLAAAKSWQAFRAIAAELGHNFEQQHYHQAIDEVRRTKATPASPRHVELAHDAEAIGDLAPGPTKTVTPFGTYIAHDLQKVSKDLGVDDAQLLFELYKDSGKGAEYNLDAILTKGREIVAERKSREARLTEREEAPLPPPPGVPEGAVASETPADGEGGEKGGDDEEIAPHNPDGSPAEEWPDPKEDMPLPYLKVMADAYDVPYSRNITAKTLVSRIMVKMYPGEESQTAT